MLSTVTFVDIVGVFAWGVLAGVAITILGIGFLYYWESKKEKKKIE